MGDRRRRRVAQADEHLHGAWSDELKDPAGPDVASALPPHALPPSRAPGTGRRPPSLRQPAAVPGSLTSGAAGIPGPGLYVFARSRHAHV